jgi:hypothetical protein
MDSIRHRSTARYCLFLSLLFFYDRDNQQYSSIRCLSLFVFICFLCRVSSYLIGINFSCACRWLEHRILLKSHRRILCIIVICRLILESRPIIEQIDIVERIDSILSCFYSVGFSFASIRSLNVEHNTFDACQCNNRTLIMASHASYSCQICHRIDYLSIDNCSQWFNYCQFSSH